MKKKEENKLREQVENELKEFRDIDRYIKYLELESSNTFPFIYTLVSIFFGIIAAVIPLVISFSKWSILLFLLLEIIPIGGLIYYLRKMHYVSLGKFKYVFINYDELKKIQKNPKTK